MKKKKTIAKKKYGQNFLRDEIILENIISGASLKKEDTVIEIGPGQGALTRHLAENSKEVYCIEIDEDLRSRLNDIEEGYENVHIVYEDFLKLDFCEFLKDRNIQEYKLVANLPYYITSPILMKLYEEGGNFDSITVMVQKEVGSRLAAESGNKEYGALTLLTQILCDVNKVCEVPNTAFYPAPKVDSIVIQLKRNNNIKNLDNYLVFKKLVKAAFFNRRKKMVNSIINSSLLNICKEDIIEALEFLQVNLMARGEDLSLDEYIDLANYITKNFIEI